MILQFYRFEKFKFVHRTVSCWEAHVGWARDQINFAKMAGLCAGDHICCESCVS